MLDQLQISDIDRYGDDWRARQSELAIRVDCLKGLATALHVNYETVRRWRSGQCPLPTHEAWRVQRLTGDMAFLQSFAVDNGLLLVPRPQAREWQPPLALFARVAEDYSRLADLLHRMATGPRATREEWVTIEETINHIQHTAETLRDMARTAVSQGVRED